LPSLFSPISAASVDYGKSNDFFFSWVIVIVPGGGGWRRSWVEKIETCGIWELTMWKAGGKKTFWGPSGQSLQVSTSAAASCISCVCMRPAGVATGALRPRRRGGSGMEGRPRKRWPIGARCARGQSRAA
jgi:hypothetical protein